MRYLLSRLNQRGAAGLVLIVLTIGCVHKPIAVNGSTCKVSWDRVDDPSVNEYLVTLWQDMRTEPPTKVVHRVPSGTTQIACQTVGIRSAGPWVVSVQACTKKDVCSKPTEPLAFTVVDQ